MMIFFKKFISLIILFLNTRTVRPYITNFMFSYTKMGKLSKESLKVLHGMTDEVMMYVPILNFFIY